jgi:hypothetical protein
VQRRPTYSEEGERAREGFVEIFALRARQTSTRVPGEGSSLFSFPLFTPRCRNTALFFGKSRRARADLRPAVNVTLTAALLIEGGGETEGKGDTTEKK